MNDAGKQGEKDTFPQEIVLVRYAEIALKKGNRKRFEDRLIINMKRQLDYAGLSYAKIYKVSGRIIVESKDAGAAEKLAKVPGVASTSPALKTQPGIESLKKSATRIFNLSQKAPSSFRITAVRLEKKATLTSNKVNEVIGQHIVDSTGCSVNLKAPVLEICFDLTAKHAFCHTQRFEGVGGIPVGISGKVITLFSGGIDSAVAAWMCMRRGCKITLVHFQHEDSSKSTPKKLERILKKLRESDADTELVCIPVSSLERQIIMHVPAEYRIIVLRRMFLRVAELLGKRDGYLAVASGDNLAQVASQTLKNMSVVSKAASILWLRPLSCFNKQEIVDLAKKIGTFEDSIEPYVDCCSFLLPTHPSTGAREETISKLESKIPAKALEDALTKLFKVKI